MRDKTNGVCPSMRLRKDTPDKTNGVCPSMRPRKDIPDNTNGVCPSMGEDISDMTNGICPSVRLREDQFNSVCLSMRLRDKTNSVCPSMRLKKDIPDKTNGVCPSMRLREDIPGDFPIVLVAVKPLAAREDRGVFGAGVEDLHPVQEPAGAEAAVVVLHADLGQLTWRGNGAGR